MPQEQAWSLCMRHRLKKQRFFLVVWELLRNFAAEIRNSNNEYSDFCLRRRYQLRSGGQVIDLLFWKGKGFGSQSDFRFFVWLGHVDQGHVNRLKILPHLIYNSIGQSADTNHLTWTCSKFTHHVTDYIFLSILSVELEFWNSPCPAFTQKHLTNGLIGYNLLIAHVDTPNRLRQRQEIGLQDCALAYSLREAICIGGEHEWENYCCNCALGSLIFVVAFSGSCHHQWINVKLTKITYFMNSLIRVN